MPPIPPSISSKFTGLVLVFFCLGRSLACFFGGYIFYCSQLQLFAGACLLQCELYCIQWVSASEHLEGLLQTKPLRGKQEESQSFSKKLPLRWMSKRCLEMHHHMLRNISTAGY